MKLIAKTFYGLEEILAEEIRQLGGKHVETHNRAVSFHADKRVLYTVNLRARTALRVLKPILNFTAHNETVLYKRLRRFSWWEVLTLDSTFAVDSTVNSPYFRHSKYVALKVKDAIVDLFRHKFQGRRPSISVESPDIRIHVHCRQKDFSISLDSSGASLHKRGHRIRQTAAPLNEALAAGMILHAGWKPDMLFFDPMCGSGTLLVEAAMMASNRAPRKEWNEFAFMKWPDYERSLWEDVRQEAEDLEVQSPDTLIQGMDSNSNLLKEVKRLLQNLGYDNTISLTIGDFFRVSAPAEKGMLMVNPPYGHRMDLPNAEVFYKHIGDTLKKKYTGWQAWILSGDKDAIKRVGLKTSRRLTLYNGPIECKFHRYDLYEGSKNKSAD